jgi:antitoxin component YwqK of YwqJK toxin-antitoxin module
MNFNIQKTKKTVLIFVPLLFFIFQAGAQYRSFTISPKGDTLNAIDHNGLKQGKWVIHVDPLRGEPGYEEEGIFTNGKKEGHWRKYTLMGDLIAYENYKDGDKDGKSEYFTNLGDLLRVENWRGYNPDQPYDTIPVYGTGSNEIISYKIIKAQPYSVKDGDWTYYEPGTGKIIKTETYDRGYLTDQPKTTNFVSNEPMKKIVPKEVLEYQEKNKHKKRIKVRDGSTSE